MLSHKNQNVGLVLTGGGARGAYQAGVLKGIAECCSSENQKIPFRVISGTSAGAITGMFLAARSEAFAEAINALCALWGSLEFSKVFRTEAHVLGSLGMKWMKGLTFGGVGATPAPVYLLDTAPLRKLIESEIDVECLKKFVHEGGALAVNTTNYQSGSGITFFSSAGRAKPWKRSGRLSVEGNILSEHILASSSIPLFFPPVKISNAFYGDGAIRMKSPVSPAIHLGSERLLVIGVRRYQGFKEAEELSKAPMDSVSIADIAGVLLNGVFLDSLDSDIERMRRINRTVAKTTLQEATLKSADALRVMPNLVIQPSEDLGQLAKFSFHHFPSSLRYLLKGLGVNEDRGAEILSYLAFHSDYTKRLIDLGYRDALAQKEEILKFFNEA